MKKEVRTNIWIVVIFLIAISLRFVFAGLIGLNPDESIYIVRAIDITKANVLSTGDQSPVYSYLVDIGYRLFGVNMLTSRLTNIIFGAFVIFLVYLIGKHLFDNKTALLATTFFSLSVYSLLWNIEPDIIATFFMLASFYFYILALEGKKENFILSFLFMGIGTLIKTTTILSLAAFLIYYIYFCIKNPDKSILRRIDGKTKLDMKTTRILILSFFLLAVLLSPIIIYNYILYTEKGVIDGVIQRYDIVTRFLPKFDKNLYAGLAAEGWSLPAFKRGSVNLVKKFISLDPIIFVFFILGMAFSFWKKKKYTGLSLIFMIIPSFFLFGSSSLSVHFVFLFPFFCIYASAVIVWFSSLMEGRRPLLVLSLIILFIQLLLVIDRMPEEAAIIKLRYHASTLPDESLIIADSRIFRGKFTWVFNDKHYIDSSSLNLATILSNDSNISFTPVYFLECMNDDCGWGQNIKQNKGIQDYNEQAVSTFKNISISKEEFKGGDFSFTLYEAKLHLKEDVLSAVDLTHNFHQYPVRWKRPNTRFDYYEAKGFNKVLDILAHLFLYISILIAIISPLFFIYLSFKKDHNEAP